MNTETLEKVQDLFLQKKEAEDNLELLNKVKTKDHGFMVIQTVTGTDEKIEIRAKRNIAQPLSNEFFLSTIDSGIGFFQKKINDITNEINQIIEGRENSARTSCPDNEGK